ncbi:MAG: hypothetical protein HY296_02465 [Thaumarchaeota archaeon]|nr:hypothetical protein [Nitrososphaerota archaeon]
MPRTNISISDETADKLSEEAMKRNKTLYAFANESIEAVVSVCRLSGEPAEIPPAWKMGRMLKDLDAVPLPGDLLEKLIKKLFAHDREWLLSTWEGEGDRIGKYLQMGYQDMSQLSEAVVEFQGLLPMKRVEVRSIDSPEAKGKMSVRAVGAGLSAESTACAEHFMRGIIASYSWTVKQSRISEGMIEFEIARSAR